MTETVLITGGAGFIGSHVADAWIAKGARVVVVDNLSTGKKDWLNPTSHFEQLDVTNASEVQRVIAQYTPDYIFHFAGHTRLRESFSDPIHDLDDNLVTTVTILQACLALRGKYTPKQIVFSSTSAVYGAKQSPPFTERSTVQPNTPYGIAKLAAEQYLKWFHQLTGVTTTILRYANVYGPRQSAAGEAGVVAKFMSALVDQGELCVYGDGTHQRDYIHVSDVVEANLAVVQQHLQGTFVVGTGVPTSTVQLAKMCIALEPNCAMTFTPDEPVEQKRSYLNAEHLQRQSDWTAKMTLEKGLAQTFAWYRDAT